MEEAEEKDCLGTEIIEQSLKFSGQKKQLGQKPRGAKEHSSARHISLRRGAFIAQTAGDPGNKGGCQSINAFEHPDGLQKETPETAKPYQREASLSSSTSAP